MVLLLRRYRGIISSLVINAFGACMSLHRHVQCSNEAAQQNGVEANVLYTKETLEKIYICSMFVTIWSLLCQWKVQGVFSQA